VTDAGEAEIEKSGEAGVEGEEVLELPDLEPPQDVKAIRQHDMKRTRNMDGEPMPERPLKRKMATTS
jgi:hypothetical protein